MVPTSAKQLAHAQSTRAQLKAAQILALIVILFGVSWIPLYSFNTVKCFCPDCSVPEGVLKFLIVLSHCNSAWNPALYAWGMKDFKRALRLMCHKNKHHNGGTKLLVFYEKQLHRSPNGRHNRSMDVTQTEYIRDTL